MLLVTSILESISCPNIFQRWKVTCKQNKNEEFKARIFINMVKIHSVKNFSLSWSMKARERKKPTPPTRKYCYILVQNFFRQLENVLLNSETKLAPFKGDAQIPSCEHVYKRTFNDRNSKRGQGWYNYLQSHIQGICTQLKRRNCNLH